MQSMRLLPSGVGSVLSAICRARQSTAVFVPLAVALLPVLVTGCATSQDSPGFWQRFGQALAASDNSVPVSPAPTPVYVPPVPASGDPSDIIAGIGQTILQQNPPMTRTAPAKIERVAVLKVMDIESKAIIQRANGEMYLIEYGVGALSLWRYEGKVVLVYSPGLFLGVGSSIVLPEVEEKARIWNAERLQ